jgi:hypothetical protein
VIVIRSAYSSASLSTSLNASLSCQLEISRICCSVIPLCLPTADPTSSHQGHP